MKEASGWGTTSESLTRPQLDHEVSCDLCVIGLGASGLAAINCAAELGMSVVGIDRQSLASGAAGRNGGFLLAGLPMTFGEAFTKIGEDRTIAWYRHTIEEQKEIFETLGDAAWKVGSARIATSDEELENVNAHAQLLRDNGFSAEPYENELGRGIFKSHDGGFHPVKRAARMAERAQSLGAVLYRDTPAEFVDSGSVVTPQATIRARNIVVAVDGRLGHIFPELRDRFTDTRLQMLCTEPLTERVIPFPTYARMEYDYWQQVPTGEVFLGGFRDEFVLDESTSREVTSSPVQNRLEEFLREDLKIPAQITHRWAGIVGYTKTGLPICEEMKPSVFAVGGYNGLGNLVGPLCGKAVVNHIQGDDSIWDVFNSEDSRQQSA